jgi:ribosome-binding protein aMBF1 (putative translation factor)
MTTKNDFRDYVAEVEADASPEELRELEATRNRFRIGTRLLTQRLGAGLTQQQLAAASGIAQADISRIEHGQANPTADTLNALARPLGVTLDLVGLTAAQEAEA